MTLSVAELERTLFSAFPAVDAEGWDHVGLSVGDPTAPVRRVLIDLDATVASVHRAQQAGADVLVAHHPVYLDAPRAFSPVAGPMTPQSAAAVYTAARTGIAIISMHTNLDRSVAARTALASRLGLAAETSLEYPSDPEAPGLGALANVDGLSLNDLARRTADAYATVPRVWGDPAKPVRRIALMGGSLGSFGEAALAQGADAVVCGEVGYHNAQDLVARGLGVIILGHDASELPFKRVFKDALIAAGMHEGNIVCTPDRRQWWIPDEGNAQ